MSHVVSIQTQVRDAAAVTAACHRLGLPPPVHRKVTLFSGTATGLAVELAGWHYPLVCELATGQLHYDNYGGAWGDPAELARFRQMYAVEKAKLEAHKKGCTVAEQCLTDGSVKLTIQVAGGAV